MATDFKKLPQAIKDLLLSEKLVDDVERTAEHHGLRGEEYGPLLRVTVQLLEGNIPATAYMASLINDLDISREKAALIAQDINRDIFNPVKEELKQIHALPLAGTGGASAKPILETRVPATASPLPQASVKPTPTPAPLPTPAQVSPPPQIPPTPHLSAPSQSIFEQKMGGTFRMKSDTTSHGGVTAPASVAPSAVMPSPSAPPKIDPYREAP